jgi:aminotransferase EvaB
MTTPQADVRMFDYVEQYAALRAEILAAIEQVLESGLLILGPRVQEFERNFARFLAAPGEAIGVGNGTDALAIALRALGIGPGDEVITAANTAIPTISAIRMASATPVLCDIEPDTLLMDVADAATRITARTRAIVPVHLFGNAVDMQAVNELAQRHGLSVVEDCAQACGTLWRGQMVGTLGDVGCFSFYPTKNLGAYGDGGLCFSGRPEVSEAIRSIRTYGCGTTYCAAREGVNSRLDELQAAILDVKLRHLPEHLQARRNVALRYHEQLDGRIARPRVAGDVEASFHLYVILPERRDELAARLHAAQIGCAVHYPTPIHRMPAYEFLNCEEGSLPVSERMAARVLSLPCYPELPAEAVERVAKVVNEVLA